MTRDLEMDWAKLRVALAFIVFASIVAGAYTRGFACGGIAGFLTGLFFGSKRAAFRTMILSVLSAGIIAWFRTHLPVMVSVAAIVSVAGFWPCYLLGIVSYNYSAYGQFKSRPDNPKRADNSDFVCLADNPALQISERKRWGAMRPKRLGPIKFGGWFT